MYRAMTVLLIAAVAASLSMPATAQEFVLSPTYDTYRPSSGLPSVGLPRQETMGYQLVKPQTQPRAEAPAGLPTSSEPSGPTQRRTDAGAIRKTAQTTQEQPLARGAAASQLPAAEEVRYPEGTVLRGRASVYDGQNLVVAGTPVRLHGAESPALAQTCLTPRALVWDCGKRAAGKLGDLIGGRPVTCVVTEPLGEGVAAVCSVSGIADLGHNMVSEGLAISNGHDRGRYLSAQAEAKSFRRGLWIGTFEAPWAWRTKNGQ